MKEKKIKFPVVVKPTNEGSSLGVKICKNFIQLNHSAKKLYNLYQELMFEPFIGGQEIQVGRINGNPLIAIEHKGEGNFMTTKQNIQKLPKLNT